MRNRTAALLALLLCACMGESRITSAYQPITIARATPTQVSARGGTQVVLSGDGFVPDVTLLLDGREHPVEFVSTGELRFTTPTLLAGRVEVIIQRDPRYPAELVGGLTVLPLELRFVQAPPHSLVLDGLDALGSAALGDVDEDGDPDLLACGASCQLLYNDGRANFLAPLDAGAGDAGAALDAGVTQALPTGARVLALEDLDLDGDPDLLVATSDGGTLYPNDRGFLAPHWVMPVAQASALGDLDGDGLPELVAAIDGTLRVGRNSSTLWGTEFGSMAPDAGALPLPASHALTLADVDADGDLDVIAATDALHDGVTLRLFFNEGGRLRELPGGLPGGPVVPVTALAAGDVDGDGAVDLIAVCDGQDRLLLNDGAAHFFDATTANFPVDNSRGTSVALVDLDLDRDLDLLVGNTGATTRLYLNDGHGRFADHTPLLPVAAQDVRWVDVRDLDGDGDLDLLVLPAVARDAQIYLSVEPRP